MMIKLLQGRLAFELEVEFKFQLPANVLHKKLDNDNNNINNRFTEMMSFSVDFVLWNWGWGWSISKGGVPLWLCIIIPQPSKAFIHPSIYLSIY